MVTSPNKRKTLQMVWPPSLSEKKTNTLTNQLEDYLRNLLCNANVNVTEHVVSPTIRCTQVHFGFILKLKMEIISRVIFFIVNSQLQSKRGDAALRNERHFRDIRKKPLCHPSIWTSNACEYPKAAGFLVLHWCVCVAVYLLRICSAVIPLISLNKNFSFFFFWSK